MVYFTLKKNFYSIAVTLNLRINAKNGYSKKYHLDTKC
uniref:Uncharacterized protein n=1 Tax=Ciona intestinalis TaxID=7719 RepID=H2Y140_CIOIN